LSGLAAFGRAVQVVATVGRHRLDELVVALLPPPAERPAWLRAALWLNPLRLFGRARAEPPVRLRLALEALGPVFIKFGQILSTRRDLLPPAYADELRRLQDQVPPFPGDEAVRLVEAALGGRIDALFARFDRTPLASASLAQVHAATLPDGSEVAVKVLRDGAEPVILADLGWLQAIARLLEGLGGDFRRLHVVDVVADYRRTILKELDLLNEAANTDELRRNFTGSPLLYVPRVFFERTARTVLTLERVYGVPVGDVEELVRRGTDMRKLAERGVETFFTQVFEDNFFHADMHPGNIFVDVDDPAQPRYIALDCAIMGSLSDSDQDYLARNLLAFFHRDYAEVARLHIASGWVPPGTDAREFERVIRNVCEPIFARPLAEISFGAFLLTLFRTARRFDMEVQPQLVLLQKTLLNIEGLGRQLYPALDLWATALPFMERWLARRSGPRALLQALASAAPDLLARLPELPALLASAPAQARRDAADRQRSLAALEALAAGARRRARGARALAIALFAAAGVVACGSGTAASVDAPGALAVVLALLGTAAWLGG
jgi:ubiquinone biosynthesis protein